MFVVKVRVDKSPIDGLGVFAAENINKGDIVWRLVPGFDRIFTQEQYEAMPAPAKNYLDMYAYWENGKIIVCGDGGIYVNHSDDPNVADAPNSNGQWEIATRYIEAGEEITSDYTTYDDISKNDLESVIGPRKAAA